MVLTVKVGDKVRALIHRHNKGEVEITTTVLRVKPKKALVEWDGGVFQGGGKRSWWVYVDNEHIPYAGWGKLIEVLSGKSLLMDNPYSNGPDGETGGLSGLLWL